MRKIYLLLVLKVLLSSSARAQVPASALADSITQSLNRQFLGGQPSPQQRAQLVRQQLAESVLDQQLHQIPLLLDYLARTVPQSTLTVRLREAMSLLLAAGAYGPLLQRLGAPTIEADFYRYQEWPRLPNEDLADVADFYIASHQEKLAEMAQRLPAAEAQLIQILLDVLPRGGVSPDMDAEIQRFRQQYPDSPYSFIVKSFQKQEKVKAELRKWHVREREEWTREAEWASKLARRKSIRKWRVAYDTWELKSGRPSRFRYGLDFHSGTGFFTSRLNTAFRPRYNMGHGLDFGWDRFALYLRNYIGWAEARTDFSYDGHVWPASQTINYYVPEVSVGFRLVNRQHFMLTPFAGLSWFIFTPPSSDSKANPALKMNVSMRHPFIAGINLDVPVIKTRSGTELGYWMLKVRSGVRVAEAPLQPALQGTLFYLDIGVGGFGRMLRSIEAPPYR